MDWIQIVTYVLSAVVAVGGALLSVIAHFKKGGAEHELKVAKEVFSNTLETEELYKQLHEIYIPLYMKQAEESGMTGNAKKVYVISQAAIFCASKGITFNNEVVSEHIEDYINFSKTVNARKDEEVSTNG